MLGWRKKISSRDYEEGNSLCFFYDDQVNQLCIDCTDRRPLKLGRATRHVLFSGHTASNYLWVFCSPSPEPPNPQSIFTFYSAVPPVVILSHAKVALTLSNHPHHKFVARAVWADLSPAPCLLCQEKTALLHEFSQFCWLLPQLEGCRCGIQGHGLVGNIGNRWMVALDDLSNLNCSVILWFTHHWQKGIHILTSFGFKVLLCL